MSNPLLVPITLDILLANAALRQRDTFRCWKHTYSALSSDTFHSSEARAFDANIDDARVGAFLHWTLPRALRSAKTGTTDYPLVPNRWLVVRISRDATGHNLQKAWVVESDCASSHAEGASYYLVDEATVAAWQSSAEPNRRAARPEAILPAPGPLSDVPTTGAYLANIGVTFEQPTWQEQATTPLFLTAVAPGNLEFSAYVPFHEGVFSFYDDLLDAPDVTTLSYLVTGWYSDPARDILATGATGFTGGTTTQEVLAALNWTLAAAAEPGPLTASLYSGMAFGLSWDRNATAAPGPDQLEATRATEHLTVAVANTSVDAFSTLVAAQLAQLPGYSDTARVVELLRAFHYDFLPLLNEANGEALLAERVRQEWFSSKTGGTRWTIVADKPAGDDKPDAAELPLTAAEQAWLRQLNQDQQALDAALQTLHSLQWDLNAAWWKSGYLNAVTQQMSLAVDNPLNLDAAAQTQLLDAANPDSPLARVLRQLASINALLAKVPQPATDDDSGNAQQAFLAGISAFATQRGIGAGKVLKAVAQPRFWAPNNPNILISGVEPSAITDPDDSLVVRLPSQQVGALTVAGTTLLPAALGTVIPPLANQAALPAGVAELYQEFFLLDPTNAAQIAAQTKVDPALLATAMRTHDAAAYTSQGGVLPAISLDAWQQQWHPLYLEWQVIYTDVPYEYQDAKTGARQLNWHFNGTDYELNPSVRGAGVTETISGRSLLSPHTQFTFGARLEAFVRQYGTGQAELQKLYDEIAAADNWRFLSQELMGFNELLTQRDPRAFRKPTVEAFLDAGQRVTFEKVTGYPGSPSQPPYDTPAQHQGLVNSTPAVKADGPSEFPFHGIRSGQFYFSHVILYDKFGRQLDLILPQDGGTHDARNFPLMRDAALVPSPNLTPTIASPVQLPPRLLQPARLDLLLVDQRDATKVLGMAPDVNPVGGFVLANHLNQSVQLFAADGTALGELALRQGKVRWGAPPHSTLTTVDVKDLAPQVAAFVAGIEGRSAAEFGALLSAIDSTLWTTDPLGNRTDQNLSVLIGRPLALVRLRAQFALDGPPLTSCDWPEAPTKTAGPAFTTSAFSIRFGSLATREDGVIGYFEGLDYTTFHSVAAPADGQQYVQPIGPLAAPEGNYIALPFDGQTAQTLTLLVDPRAAIHATTGILPVKMLTIPRQFVDAPLARLEVAFRLGPLLSRLKPVATPPTAPNQTPAFTTALSYLPISEKNGAWSWWESTQHLPDQPTTWQSYGLADATTTAALGAGPATLREGYLQLLTDLATPQQ